MTEAEEILGYIKENCPTVCRMRQQLSLNQAEGLLGIYPLKDIKDQLDKMNNRPYLPDKFASVFFTVKSWFEQDIKRGYYKLAVRSEQLAIESKKVDVRREFLKHHPVGSQFTVNSSKYEVVSDSLVINIETKDIMPITIAAKFNNL